MTASEDIANLVEEYKSIPEAAATLAAGRVSHGPDKVEKLLIAEGE